MFFFKQPKLNELTVEELKEKLDRRDKFELIDVREKKETDISTIPGRQLVPMGTIAEASKTWDKSKTYVIYCAIGGRSASVTDYLVKQGFEHVYNLTGGIKAWRAKIDPSLDVY